MAKKDIDYESFGLLYRVGRRVCHLAAREVSRPLCGLSQLGLVWSKKRPDEKVCRNCKRAVAIVKVRRKRVAVFRSYSGLEAHIEQKRGGGQ